jgi:hypothetical protein
LSFSQSFITAMVDISSPLELEGDSPTTSIAMKSKS